MSRGTKVDFRDNYGEDHFYMYQNISESDVTEWFSIYTKRY